MRAGNFAPAAACRHIGHTAAPISYRLGKAKETRAGEDLPIIVNRLLTMFAPVAKKGGGNAT
jgi:hypothetical protein